ncbi:multidrug RND transporter [Brevibacterium ravenspurgense]|uniref:Multidrug RND transporter n=1 Tax=Brevibacterium ravenspurgense TaxID=479117 RepID=A0A2I1IGN8_9MICO|nr:MFS transporter [Brevibacterium ravenspurgense]PKY70285.1 multidrug RND transporter [Brevibacterium ravenspurgense]
MRPGWFFGLVLHTVLLHGTFNAAKVMVSYKTLAEGGDAFAVGMMVTAYSLVPLFAALTVGRLVDRGLYVPILWVGTAACTAALAGAALSSGIPALVLFSMLLGLGQLLMTVSSQAFIPASFAPQELNSRFGTLTLGVSIGQTLGMPLAGAVAAWASDGTGPNAEAGLWAMCALAALAFPCVLVVMRRPAAQRVGRAQAKAAAVSPRALLGTPGMKSAIFASMATLAAIDLMSAYLPVIGEKHGLSVVVVTALITVRTVATIVSRAFMGALTARFDPMLLLWLSSLAAGVTVFAIPLWVWVPFLAVIMVVSGFGFGLTQPLTMTWVSMLATPGNRAAVMSIRLAGNRLSQVVMPIAASAVASVAGVGSIFFLSGGVLMLAAGLTLRAPRPKTAEVPDR